MCGRGGGGGPRRQDQPQLPSAAAGSGARPACDHLLYVEPADIFCEEKVWRKLLLFWADSGQLPGLESPPAFLWRTPRCPAPSLLLFSFPLTLNYLENAGASPTGSPPPRQGASRVFLFEEICLLSTRRLELSVAVGGLSPGASPRRPLPLAVGSEAPPLPSGT